MVKIFVDGGVYLEEELLRFDRYNPETKELPCVGYFVPVSEEHPEYLRFYSYRERGWETGRWHYCCGYKFKNNSVPRHRRYRKLKDLWTLHPALEGVYDILED